jgi:hypothetical protein
VVEGFSRLWPTHNLAHTILDANVGYPLPAYAASAPPPRSRTGTRLPLPPPNGRAKLFRATPVSQLLCTLLLLLNFGNSGGL